MSEPQDSRLAWGIADIAAKTGLSIGLIRQEVRRGNIRVRHFGRRVLVLDEDLRSYLERETTSKSALDPDAGEEQAA